MNRRSILSISAITALGLAVLPGSAVAQQKSLKEQIVGTWTFVSALDVKADGTRSNRWGSDPKGIFMFDGNGNFAVVRRPTIFISHFQEDEIGELFEVITVADAVIAERRAEAPDFGDDAVSAHRTPESLTADHTDNTDFLAGNWKQGANSRNSGHASEEKPFASFKPSLEPWTVRLEFGRADSLQMPEPVDFAVCRDTGKNPMGRRGRLNFVNIFGTMERRALLS